MHAVVVTIFSLFTSCIRAEADQVRMTLLSKGHFKSEVNGEYQCHFSESRTGATVTSYRDVETRNNFTKDGEPTGYNRAPPPAVYRGPRVDYYPHYKVSWDVGNNDSFGVFGCEAVKSGKKTTRISTTRMRSDADIVPADGLFTQTVNVRDKDVSITMKSPTGRNTRDFIWRMNGGNLRSLGKATYSISGEIQITNAGTYECHIRYERYMAKHGLKLLLVRACKATRWGPPDCLGVCDSCYNGGICDENNGKCVCPPGFMGKNCLKACGGNRYGYNCEIRCSSMRNDNPKSCGRYLFCLVHPFGCRCNTGFKELDCNTACKNGTFGASCLQSCSHCISGQCDRYTGTCTGPDTGCKSGWTGDSCQECDGNYFGAECNEDCHCSKENCNRESGLCKPGGCLAQWVDRFPPYLCQTGLQNITYTKMNPGVPVPVTCYAVEGPEGNVGSLQLVLSKDAENLEDDNITAGDGNTTRSFSVANVGQGDMLYCQLRNNSNKLAVMSVKVDAFVLPVLISAPVNDWVNCSDVTISWSAWDENTDEGDPPLIGYIPYYKVAGEINWRKRRMVSPETLTYTFTSLNPDTLYSLSVSAVREGNGGEGPNSPELSVRTICDEGCTTGSDTYVVVAVIVPIVAFLVILVLVDIYLRYRGKLPGKAAPQKPAEAMYENEVIDADDYSTIAQDHEKSHHTVYQGLNGSKNTIKKVAEEETDAAGYEIPASNLNRNNTDISNYNKGRANVNLESHYENPDKTTNENNSYVTVID